MTSYSRTERIRDALREVLADGQYHEREQVIAQVVSVIHTADALEYALIRDYQDAKHRASKTLSAEGYRQWVAEHPDREHYERTPNAADPAFGARQMVLAVLAHGRKYGLHSLRENANGSGHTLIRWEGGEAAS